MSHTVMLGIAGGVGVVVLVMLARVFLRMLAFLTGCSATLAVIGVSGLVGYLTLRQYGSAAYVPVVICVVISLLVFRSIRLNVRG